MIVIRSAPASIAAAHIESYVTPSRRGRRRASPVARSASYPGPTDGAQIRPAALALAQSRANVFEVYVTMSYV